MVCEAIHIDNKSKQILGSVETKVFVLKWNTNDEYEI